MSLLDLPELQSLHRPEQMIRLSAQQDIPLTARLRRLIDTSAFQRLRHLRQLGLVQLVYPSATHSRFEHSLGVYHLALRYISRLSNNDAFNNSVTTGDLEAFLIAALLHDVGHWPFCHPIEDMELVETVHHETLSTQLLADNELRTAITKDWSCDVEQVIRILNGKTANVAEELLNSLISGPIDIDKMDYLPRDSANCGVPYGNHFDQDRLISSLTISSENSRLAISEKGRTAAELMVFSRYVMFSEVYWHRTVRSATAMFQRLFFSSRNQLPLDSMHHLSDDAFIKALTDLDTSEMNLAAMLFGETRQLYKCVLEFDHQTQPELHSQIAHSTYSRCSQLTERLHKSLSSNSSLPRDAIILDAPPAKLEVQFDVNVISKDGRTVALSELSPVVNTLATEQFDKYVKKVRLFIHPDYVDVVPAPQDLYPLLTTAAEMQA